MVPPKRVPPGYVSQEAAEAIRKDTPLHELVAEFESLRVKPSKTTCKVCDDENFTELIDTLLLRGAGCGSIVEFLFHKFAYTISPTTLLRHRKLHLNGRTTE